MPPRGEEYLVWLEEWVLEEPMIGGSKKRNKAATSGGVYRWCVCQVSFDLSSQVSTLRSDEQTGEALDTILLAEGHCSGRLIVTDRERERKGETGNDGSDVLGSLGPQL